MIDYTDEDTFIDSLNRQPRTGLTEEQRKDLYKRLVAERQGRSNSEMGAIIGGITQGLTDIATADAGAAGLERRDVGAAARAIGQAQDRAESEDVQRWRQLLGEDRRERAEANEEAGRQFQQGITTRQQDRLDQQLEDERKNRQFQQGIATQTQDRLAQQMQNQQNKALVNQGISTRQQDRLDKELEWKMSQANPANQPKQVEEKLPIEDRTQLATLSRSVANKRSIVNQLEAAGAKFDEALRAGNTDLAVTLGRQMLKTLNSTEGADAVGAEEAKRLGGLLEFKIANLFEPGSIVGRDLDMFSDQIAQTRAGIEDAIKANESAIQDIRNPGAAKPKTIQYQGKTYTVDEQGNMTEVPE